MYLKMESREEKKEPCTIEEQRFAPSTAILNNLNARWEGVQMRIAARARGHLLAAPAPMSEPVAPLESHTVVSRSPHPEGAYAIPTFSLCCTVSPGSRSPSTGSAQ